MNIKTLYRQARARGLAAHAALAAARRHITGPLADYEKAMTLWKAEPDKRRYAPGGSANRPKFPTFCRAPEPSPVSGLRACGFVDELFPSMADHRGWFTDTNEDSVYRGQVWKLPARAGKCVYIAGYVECDSGHVVLETYDDGSIELFTGDNPGYGQGTSDALRDAARAANGLAKRNAEREREYSEKWQEASSLSGANDYAHGEMRAIRSKVSQRIKVLRALPDDAQSEREHMVGQIADLREDFAETLAKAIERSERIAELKSEGIEL